MVSEEELESSFTHIAEGIGICFNDHTIAGSERAAGDDTETFAFDEAEAASAEDGDARMIAEGGDIDAVIAGELKNIFLAFDRISAAIDDDRICIFHG